MTESYADKVERARLKRNRRIIEDKEYIDTNPELKRNLILQEIQRIEIIGNSLKKELIELMIGD